MVSTVKSDGENRIRPGGVALAMALLVTGSAIGFGIRNFIPQDPAAPGVIPKRQQADASPPEGTIEAPVPVPRALPPRLESTTLSNAQWSRILANPAAFSLRLKDLRTAVNGGDRSRIVTNHGELFGWDAATMNKVEQALRAFSSALWELEAESAEVTFPEPDQIEVSYGPMAAAIEPLFTDFTEALTGIIGARNTRQFVAVADLEGLKAERGPDTRDRIAVQTDPDWGFITVTIDHGHLQETSSRILEMEDAVEQAKALTSPAIDWENFLQRQRPPIPVDE